MLLRSGYNTEFSCGAEIWSPNFMTPKGEFKKEVREMRERLKKRNEWGEREVIMTKADWIKIRGNWWISWQMKAK